MPTLSLTARWLLFGSRFRSSVVWLSTAGVIYGVLLSSLVQRSNFNQQMTSDSHDIAVFGPSFIQVIDPAGQVAYVRSGKLQLTDLGELSIVRAGNQFKIHPLVTAPLDSRLYRVSLPSGIQVQTHSSDTWQDIGRIQMAMFLDPAGLVTVNGIYTATSFSGPPILDLPDASISGFIRQHWLEVSESPDIRHLAVIPVLVAFLAFAWIVVAVVEHVNFTLPMLYPIGRSAEAANP